jgi:transmembrane sensor
MTEFDLPQSTEAQASYWFVLLELPECTDKQRARFKQWLNESEANQQAFSLVKRSHAAVEKHLTDPALAQISVQALEQAKLLKATSLKANQSAQTKSWMSWPAIAAMLIMLIGLGGFGFNHYSHQNSLANNKTNSAIETYQTKIGERSVVVLADGSSVTLNTNSQIAVSFSNMTRSIKLIKGQVFFDVEKDVTRPFIVEVGNKRVIALGTAFDIRFDDNKQVEVTLIEGRVAVDDILKDDNILKNSPKETINGPTPTQLNQSKVVELSPGEKLIAKKDKAVKVVSLDTTQKTTSWTQGHLIYRLEPITSVIKEMNRYSTKKIKLDPHQAINDIKISGVFKLGKNAYFLETITEMYPLQAMRTGTDEKIN